MKLGFRNASKTQPWSLADIPENSPNHTHSRFSTRRRSQLRINLCDAHTSTTQLQSDASSPRAHPVGTARDFGALSLASCNLAGLDAGIVPGTDHPLHRVLPNPQKFAANLSTCNLLLWRCCSSSRTYPPGPLLS